MQAFILIFYFHNSKTVLAAKNREIQVLSYKDVRSERKSEQIKNATENSAHARVWLQDVECALIFYTKAGLAFSLRVSACQLLQLQLNLFQKEDHRAERNE